MSLPAIGTLSRRSACHGSISRPSCGGKQSFNPATEAHAIRIANGRCPISLTAVNRAYTAVLPHRKTSKILSTRTSLIQHSVPAPSKCSLVRIQRPSNNMPRICATVTPFYRIMRIARLPVFNRGWQSELLRDLLLMQRILENDCDWAIGPSRFINTTNGVPIGQFKVDNRLQIGA